MIETLLHIILLLTRFTLCEQSTITGKVTDAAKQPLSFSNVVLYDNTKNTPLKAVVVEENGSYTFTIVCSGSFFIWL